MLRPPSDVAVPEGLCLTLSPGDGMFEGNHRHYLNVGRSALKAILQGLDYAEAPPPADILDFGCGAGRVLRWVRHEFPEARIVAADVRTPDVAFCERMFGAEPWVTPASEGVAPLHRDDRFDLIWAGSVMTHLDADDTRALFAKFVSWLKPGGVAAASLHGLDSYNRILSGAHTYGMQPDDHERIVEGFLRSGYGYADYPHTKGYGISLTRPAWAIRMVRETPEVSLLMYAERAWDNHHDVIAVRRD